MKELTPRPAPPDRVRLVVCAAGLLLLFGYFLAYLYHHESKDFPTHLGDFRTAYQAAQFVVQHRDIYEAGPYPDQRYIYPPLTAVLYTPLTTLSELAAAHVALVLNTAMLLASALLVSREMLRRLGAARSAGALLAVALVAAALDENEMRAELTMLETNALVCLLFSLALTWLDRAPAKAGLALALAINVKYLPLVFVPWLILRRRWKLLTAMATGTILFALLPALVLGPRENFRCLRVALGGLGGAMGGGTSTHGKISVRGVAADLSVSVPSMFARVFASSGLTGPGAMALAAVVGLLALGVIAWIYRANGLPLWRWPDAVGQVRRPYAALVAIEWAGMIVVTLAFNPQTNMRHLVLTLFVYALAGVVLVEPRRGVGRAPALVAVLLVMLSYIMPFSRQGSPLRHAYFRYSIPGWCLLIGYLVILDRALRYVRSQSSQSAQESGGSEVVAN